MKKTLIFSMAAILAANIAFANIINNNNTSFDMLNKKLFTQNNKPVLQKSIKDLQSYEEFENVMQEAIKLGDTTKAYPLGLFYLKDFSFKKHDTKKAIKYFKVALQNPLTTTQAAIYLSELVPPLEALDYLEYSIKLESPNNKKIVILRYLEIVLTYFYKNKIFLERAYKIVTPYVYKANDPLIDFAYAHLLLLLDKTELANKFLNSACNNPNASKKLLNRCFNTPNLIKVKNEKGITIHKPQPSCVKGR